MQQSEGEVELEIQAPIVHHCARERRLLSHSPYSGFPNEMSFSAPLPPYIHSILEIALSIHIVFRFHLKFFIPTSPPQSSHYILEHVQQFSTLAIQPTTTAY